MCQWIDPFRRITLRKGRFPSTGWSKQPHHEIILRLRFDPLHDVGQHCTTGVRMALWSVVVEWARIKLDLPRLGWLIAFKNVPPTTPDGLEVVRLDVLDSGDWLEVVSATLRFYSWTCHYFSQPALYENYATCPFPTAYNNPPSRARLKSLGFSTLLLSFWGTAELPKRPAIKCSR